MKRETDMMTDEEMSAAIAALPTEIRVQTKAFGPYVWRRVGQRPYTRKDGRNSILIEMEADCAFCSKPVLALATVGQSANRTSSNFAWPFCSHHRPTHRQMKLLRCEREFKAAGFRRFEACRISFLLKDAAEAGALRGPVIVFDEARP
jgi:hypothetical protein